MRGKPLITFVTSIRPNSTSSIAGDAISPLISQIQAVPAPETEAAFLIISYGGDPTAAIRIVNILRERFNKFSVLLPYVAFSAATLLSLSADDIVMHPFSSLGPLDPQFTIPHYLDGKRKISFSSEDLRHYLNFVHDDVGITDQASLNPSLVSLSRVVNPLYIGAAKKRAISVFICLRQIPQNPYARQRKD